MSADRPRSRWLPIHAVAVFAFLYLPIAVLILYSFNGEGVGGFPPRHLTLDWYRMLFADGPIWDSVLNSLQVAFAAMAIALAFGVPAALALDRAQFPGKALFWRITVPNLKLPIIGAALLIFTLSMDEIAVSFFLIGRDNTLPLEIWGRLRRGITPEINAVSTIIFVFSLVAIVFWYRLRVRAEGSTEVVTELVQTTPQNGM